MSPENPKSDLDRALEKLGESIRKRESERNYRNFESETGFSGSIEFFDGGLANLRLHEGGQNSLFTVDANGVRLMELRGVDDEHLDEPRIAEHHLNEAWRLYEAGELDRFKTNEDGQREMDF